MNNSKLPTAEEFIQQGFSNPPYIDIDNIQFKGTKVKELVHEYAILKAKFYVQAALETAANNAKIGFADGLGGEGTKDHSIIKNSILNAYPLTNIK